MKPFIWLTALAAASSFLGTTLAGRFAQHARKDTALSSGKFLRGNHSSLVTNQTVDGASQCGPQSYPGGRSMDLVITFWTNRFQSNQKTLPALAQLNATIHNFLDIAYELRTFQKYKFLDHVRRVYILMDQAVLSAYGAPRTLDFLRPHGTGVPELHLVTDQQIGIANHIRPPKFGALANIPGILDWFMYVPDDDLMLNDFYLPDFWDAKAQKPKIYAWDTWGEGWCNGHGRGFGSFHGPVFVNKCFLQAVAYEYDKPQYAPYSWSKSQAGTGPLVDTICLYSKKTLEWGRSLWGGSPYFFKSCHTNAHGSHSCTVDDLLAMAHTRSRHLRWANVQGPGVSDDYNSYSYQQVQKAEQFYSIVAGPGPMYLEKGGAR
eukprot:gnl/TRDRNA2_/TRDRNA2_205160_c0_seq1.p1 gnl/TRDRNA2_/TRDRNA2_205160_c0~~gnl/TRDRNA2_/TRDRNA2_205160_c0_seq1.p1  ORF type:complete len:376 (-),score=46.22 gnl/TRDRNA2_/TRDRNA2_205160_c0_seq1:103-1230(-)